MKFLQLTNVPAAIASYLAEGSTKAIEIGQSTANVYQIIQDTQHFYLKVSSISPYFSFQNEVDILHWLAGKLPVPRVQEYEIDSQNEYLILSNVAGHNCVEAMALLDPHLIIEQLALGLRQIHALDISDCPFNQRIADKLKHGYQRVINGLVDEDDFDPNHMGKTGQQIYTALVDLQPEEDDLVFSHGDYCLPNIIINSGQICGYIDLDRAGISDRYNDLAIASRSIASNFGQEYEQLFFDCYGLKTVDQEKIQYYRMMDELF